MDPEGSYSDPLLLLMITSVIASAGSIAHQAAASSAGQESLADLMDLGDPNPVLLAGVGLVLLAVFPLVTQFIYAGFMWAACLLVGAKGGYRGTYRAVVYAMPGITIIQSAINLVAAGLMLLGPTVAGVVTTCSGLLSSISGLYLLAITMFALRSAHRLSTGRAIAVMAILLGLLFAISCVVGILAVGVVALLV